MEDKTLGQIAYEADQDWRYPETSGQRRPWAAESLAERARWEHSASAVYEATVKVLGAPAAGEASDAR